MSFLDYLKEEYNFTETENGAVALKSTTNACLDAFGSMGVMKNSSDTEIIDVFKKAFFEDKKLAMRLLFYIRDIRGGQGMRRVFRICLSWLAVNYPEYVINNFDNILEYGRGDDFACLIDDDHYVVDAKVAKLALDKIANTLLLDLNNTAKNEPITLMGKWAWSINSSSKTTKKLGKMLCKKLTNGNEREYRKILSMLRGYSNVVEKKMSANEWNTIDYSKVPAKASMIYSDAFEKHDEEGYNKYILDLAKDPSKVNAKSLFPVDIVSKVYRGPLSVCNGSLSAKDKILYNAMWENLPNYFTGEETGICMCDTSGSMSGEPLLVSLALGIYCADKCKGPFHNHFITFDTNPVLQEIKGDTIFEKVNSIASINPWNTDIEKAFDLILNTAIKNHCKQEELPSKLYIISDMQFDQARGAAMRGYYWDSYHPTVNQTFMQTMKQKYAKYGYTLPAIVYWNVRESNCGMFQDKFDGEDCCMVSGYSASLFKAVAEGTTFEETVDEKGNVTVKQKIDPMTVMLKTLSNERYDKVWVG